MSARAVGPSVLGIDPSMTATGIAEADQTWTITYPKGTGGDRRLGYIYALVRQSALGLDLAVIEELPPARVMGLRALGLVQGVVRLALLHANVPYVVVPPASVKVFATGRGAATKPDMRVAYLQDTGTDERDDNRVDAYYLRQIGLAHFGACELHLSALRSRALDALDWTPAEGLA